MVYIHSWQAYQDAAEALYEKSPDKARYCVKWKSSEGKLVLKITDDTTCIKFKTYSSIFLNRFEALNLSLMQKMTNKRQLPPAVSSGPASQPTPTEEAPASQASAPTASAVTPSASAPSGGGVKKKGKGKKKK
ncbi:hypothetical protein AX16_007360 [Volvariella volvacea WC 439]|nr:hypothetical protein AX16_007360 [Volvariella volvacea WC 439]